MSRGNLLRDGPVLCKKHRALKLFAALALFVSLACNAFSGNLQPLPEPPELPQQLTPAATPAELAATATLTDPGAVSDITVTTLVDLNIRTGPGVQFERVGFLPEGTTVPAIGVDPATGWWKIICPASIQSSQCWVSGGAAFVSVSSAGESPTVAPPTPPAGITPEAEAATGRLAYLDNGQLYVAEVTLDQGLEAAMYGARQVSDGPPVQRFLFSPDGAYLAYLSGRAGETSLHVVRSDGSEPRMLVASNTLPEVEHPNETPGARHIDAFQWSPDGQEVAFNTVVAGRPAADEKSVEDLWTVTLNGRLQERFAPGQGGADFLFQTDRQVLFSRSDEIVRATLASTAQESVVAFDPVDTGGDVTYYPQLQLTSSGVYVAIPSPDSVDQDGETVLYRIGTEGRAQEVGRVTAASLDYPFVWSDDGRQVAYFQRPVQGSPMPRLIIAAGDGSGPTPYAGGADLNFVRWSPQSSTFLYQGGGYYALGQLQAPPRQVILSEGRILGDVQWLNNTVYLLTIDDAASGQWELRQEGRGGEAPVIARGLGLPSAFTLWPPEG